MKKAVVMCALIVCLIMPSVVLVSYAHSGRTDSRGGHTNRSTGEYHYHHGYSAHDHYDMDGDGAVDCPYDFKGKTNHSSGNEKDSSTSVTIKQPEKAVPKDESSAKAFVFTLCGMYAAMFIIPVLLKK